MTRTFVLPLIAVALGCVTPPQKAPAPRAPTRAEVLDAILAERTERASTDAERLKILLVKRGLAVGCDCDREVAELAARLNFPGLARDALSRLTRANPTERALFERYAPLAAQVDAKEALWAYEQLFELTDDAEARLPLRYALIALYTELEQPERRKTHVDEALKLAPNDRALARMALKTATDADRERALERVIRLEPENKEAAAELAKIRTAKRPDDALRLYNSPPLRKDPTAVEARRSLLATLKVPDRPVQGRVQTVVRAIRRAVAPVYRDLAANKSGRIDVAFETNASGRVVTVNFVNDTLDLPRVRAAILGHLYRAQIRGGAKVHDFSMEFEND